jgi:hypothetical protein
MYLYVKTHNKTGLKYLGKTVSKDPHKYTGSGVYWLKHLEKHGPDYTTEILVETEDVNVLKEMGLYYSNLWNIVHSDNWANLMVEQGDGGDASNSEAFKEYIKCRDYYGEQNPFYGKTHTDETKDKLSKSASVQWKGVPKTEEHKMKIAEGNTGKVFSDERKNNISKACMGRQPYNKGVIAPKFECSHCKKVIGGASNFKRWHGENCKDKK